MPSRLIKANDLKPTPWKNGGGVTFEVAISPPGSTISALDFDWRVSIAQVDAAGPFSEFPGYDRKLVVWKGPGLKINGTPRARMEAWSFEGETPVAADLITASVKDFGVIYNRDRCKCEFTTQRIAEDSEAVFNLASGDLYVLCASGEVRIEAFYLNPGDLFHTSTIGPVRIKGLERSEIVVAHVASIA